MSTIQQLDDDASTQNLTLVQAVRDGLYGEMSRDDDVLVMGEDVGKNGGVFRATPADCAPRSRRCARSLRCSSLAQCQRPALTIVRTGRERAPTVSRLRASAVRFVDDQ